MKNGWVSLLGQLALQGGCHAPPGRSPQDRALNSGSRPAKGVHSIPPGSGSSLRLVDCCRAVLSGWVHSPGLSRGYRYPAHSGAVGLTWVVGWSLAAGCWQCAVIRYSVHGLKAQLISPMGNAHSRTAHTPPFALKGQLTHPGLDGMHFPVPRCILSIRDRLHFEKLPHLRTEWLRC